MHTISIANAKGSVVKKHVRFQSRLAQSDARISLTYHTLFDDVFNVKNVKEESLAL